MGGICNNQQVPRNPRAGVKDMLLSLAVILVPVMLIVWFFTRTPDEPNIQQVDWKPVVASALPCGIPGAGSQGGSGGLAANQGPLCQQGGSLGRQHHLRREPVGVGISDKQEHLPGGGSVR